MFCCVIRYICRHFSGNLCREDSQLFNYSICLEMSQIHRLIFVIWFSQEKCGAKPCDCDALLVDLLMEGMHGIVQNRQHTSHAITSQHTPFHLITAQITSQHNTSHLFTLDRKKTSTDGDIIFE